MIGVILGILGMFGSLILGVGIVMNMIHGFIWILVLSFLCFFVSLFVIVWDFLTGGIAGVFAGARINGNPVGIVLRNDKTMKFSQMRMEEGMAKDKKLGRFIIIPDSVYSAQNGVRTFLAYYKYGVSIHPNFIRAATRLREKGIENIEQVDEISETEIPILDDNGKKVGSMPGGNLSINLDEDIIKAREDDGKRE